MRRAPFEIATGLLALGLLSTALAAQESTPPAVKNSAKQIVLIRPGASGLLPDEETVGQLFGSWQWPESINPQPSAAEGGYFVEFAKLESRHDDAILGIVSVSASSEPQAVRRALQQAIDYLETALTEIGDAIQMSRQGEKEQLLREMHELESEIEALETREVELRGASEGEDPNQWSAKLEQLRNELASLNARIGDQHVRLNMARDQLAEAKQRAKESAGPGEKALHALQELARMRLQEVTRASQLAETGVVGESEAQEAREQLLRAEIQVREKEQELAQQSGAPVRLLSDQEQQISHELQALEAQRQRFEGELNKLQSPEARGAVIERQRLRRRLDRARQQLADVERQIEQLSRRQPEEQPPRVIRIQPKAETQSAQ